MQEVIGARTLEGLDRLVVTAGADRFEARADVVGRQRDRSGRPIVVRWAVADAELVDRPLDIRVEAADELLGLGRLRC